MNLSWIDRGCNGAHAWSLGPMGTVKLLEIRTEGRAGKTGVSA
jgi:hypothetical protein